MTEERPPLGWSVMVVVGLGNLAAVAFSDGWYAWWFSRVTTRPPQGLFQAMFVGAVLTHLGEAFYAVTLVRRLGLDAQRTKWFWQTVLLGFPSLGILVRRARASQ